MKLTMYEMCVCVCQKAKSKAKQTPQKNQTRPKINLIYLKVDDANTPASRNRTDIGHNARANLRTICALCVPLFLCLLAQHRILLIQSQTSNVTCIKFLYIWFPEKANSKQNMMK